MDRTTAFIIIFLFSKMSTLVCQISDRSLNVKINKSNGEILNGYIIENDEKSISLGVKFKHLSTDKQEIQILAHEINKMIIDESNIYEKQLVKVGVETDLQPVLSQKLVEGVANLYKFKLFGKEYFNLIMPDSTYLLQNDEIRSGTLVKYYFRIALKNALKVENQEVESTKISFSQSDFITLVSTFNLKNNNQNIIFKSNNIGESFIIGNLGGIIKGKQNEFYSQLTLRKYFPKIDKNTSMNVSFYVYSGNRTDEFGPYKIGYLGVPASIQYNFLNKNVRPYFFGGVSLIYVYNYHDRRSTSITPKIMLPLHGGIGMELNLTNVILIKSEIRFELNRHLLNLGLGYIFKSTSKK